MPETLSLLMTPSRSLSRAWAWSVFYTLFVILFGAVVRITGSGAGCGQHWPTCHGEVAHLPRSVETVIELSHRVTSGVSMLLVFFLTVWTFRRLSPGHVARRCAVWSSVFMVTEALVGAGLVLLELVGKNDSVSRALVMGLHLLNTYALLFAMVGAAWASRFLKQRQLHLFSNEAGRTARGEDSGLAHPRIYVLGAVLIVAVSAAGAVTALGDTVYPVAGRSSLDVAGEIVRGTHFLEHLRGVHPILAALAAGFWLSAGARFSAPWGRAILIVVLVQLGVGLLNIYLSAPGWMQVVHLALANALWLCWVLGWFARPLALSSEQAT